MIYRWYSRCWWEVVHEFNLNIQCLPPYYPTRLDLESVRSHTCSVSFYQLSTFLSRFFRWWFEKTLISSIFCLGTGAAPNQMVNGWTESVRLIMDLRLYTIWIQWIDRFRWCLRYDHGRAWSRGDGWRWWRGGSRVRSGFVSDHPRAVSDSNVLSKTEEWHAGYWCWGSRRWWAE